MEGSGHGARGECSGGWRVVRAQEFTTRPVPEPGAVTPHLACRWSAARRDRLKRMEIHAPHEPLHSWKDFAYHMLTVVLGILIALGLENLVEWNHHRRMARETSDALVGEIRRNAASVRVGLTAEPALEARLREALRLAAHPEKATNAALPDLGFSVLALSATAWSTAQYSGALAWMEPAQVSAFARVYVVQQAFLNDQEATLSHWEDVQRWTLLMQESLGVRGLSKDELGQMRREMAGALIHLQTEASAARTLAAQYERIPDAK